MIQIHTDKQKAIDLAKWLNFKHRNTESSFGVIPHIEKDWLVCSQEFADDIEISFLDILPSNYADMDYEHIKSIRTDIEPLKHWEQLTGAISTMEGELLRYILAERIPLKKLIKYELGSRGYDDKGQWIGFEKSEKFWLKGTSK